MEQQTSDHRAGQSDPAAELRAFLLDRLGPDYAQLDLDSPLLAWGLLDSIMVQVLLAFIEDRYRVTIPHEVIKPESFGTIRQIAAVVAELVRGDAGLAAEANAFAGINALMESYGLENRWVELPGGRQHLLAVEGAGPPLLCLSGLGSPASSWGTFLRSLAGSRRALALDLPGFGISEPLAGGDPSYGAHVENVARLVEELLGEPAVLVGNSAGGMLAAGVARSRPDLCRALIVVAFGRVRDGVGWWRDLRALSADPDAFWQRAFHQPPPLTSGLRAQFQAVLSSDAYLQFLDEGALAQLDRQFADLQLPTLFIGGLEDRIIAREVVEAGAAQVPGSRLEWISRCGHFAQSERAEEVRVYVDHFLEGLG